MQDGISSGRDWRGFFPAKNAELVERIWGALGDRESGGAGWLVGVCLALWCTEDFLSRWQAAASPVFPDGCPGLCGAFCWHALERKRGETMQAMEPCVRPVKKPKPTEYELACLDALWAGNASWGEAQSVKDLCDRCSKYGCACDPSGKRPSRSMGACPGWCDALEANEKLQRQRQARLDAARASKPRSLTGPEMEALGRIGSGEEPLAADVLRTELLAQACKEDGCIAEGKTCSSGIDICPKWCETFRRAWEMWWASPCGA